MPTTAGITAPFALARTCRAALSREIILRQEGTSKYSRRSLGRRSAYDLDHLSF